MPAEKLKIRLEAILPKDRNYPESSFDKLMANLEAYMVGPLDRSLTKEFNKTVEGWHHRPNFISAFSRPYNGANLQLWIHPQGSGTTQWSRVSLGTGPRQIHSDTVMTFPAEYDPRTRPGGPYGGPGRKYGKVIRTHSVGVKKPHRVTPRLFSKRILDKEGRGIESDMRKIADKALR